MFKIAELGRNAYVWGVAILLLIATAAHYASADLGEVHLWVLFVGATPTIFCAMHFGLRWGTLVGLLSASLLFADVVLFPNHTVSSELAMELTALAGFLAVGAVVGDWADRRNKNRPSLKLGDYWSFVAQTSMGQYITTEEWNFISRCLTDLPERPRVILDAGAGSGRFEPLLASFASWVICTEIDPSKIHRLTQAGGNIVPIVVHRASNCLPLADTSVGCVICMEVPALAEQGWFYAECQRVLRPGGAIVLLVTNRLSWKGALAAFWPTRYTYESRSYYQRTIGDIRLCLRRHGFTVRRAVGLNWLPFSRASDSPLVGALTALEKILQLHRLVFCSPWVLLEVRKE